MIFKMEKEEPRFSFDALLFGLLSDYYSTFWSFL